MGRTNIHQLPDTWQLRFIIIGLSGVSVNPGWEMSTSPVIRSQNLAFTLASYGRIVFTALLGILETSKLLLAA